MASAEPRPKDSLLAQYLRSLKPLEVEEPIDVWVHRPLAFLLARALYPTPISPNLVTLGAMLLSMAAGVAMFVPFAHHLQWAAACMFSSAVFDCADGQLARLRRSYSAFGRMLDGSADVLGSVVAIGGSLWVVWANQTDPLWGALWVALAAVTTVTSSFHISVYDHYKNLFVKFTQPSGGEGEDYEVVVARAKNSTDRRFYIRVAWVLYVFWVKSQNDYLSRFDPYTRLRYSELPDFDPKYAEIYRRHQAGLMRWWRSLYGFGLVVFGLSVGLAFEVLEYYVVLRFLLLNGLFYGYLRGAQRRASQAVFAELGLGGGAPGGAISPTNASLKSDNVRGVRAALIVSVALSFTALAPASSAAIWPSVVERVTQQMRSPDPAVRRSGAQRIADLPVTAARRLALAALEDSDVEVRLLAIEVAVETGVPGIGDKVLPWLAESEPRVRLAAADALRRQPSPRAVAQLGRALSDSDPTVRAAAARALGASESEAAVLPLLGRLDDSVPEVRQEVVAALARLGDARAVVPLIGKVEDARPSVRRAVARALGELGDPRSVGALVLSLRDADDDVKVAAIAALGRIGDPSAAPSIVALLENDPAPLVRSQALSALGRLGTAEALNVLVAELGRDEPGHERAPVLSALVRAGAPAIAPLRACVQGPPQGERNGGCALALGQSGDKASAAVIVQAIERSAVTPEVGLLALAALQERSVVPTVLEYLRANDPRVRSAARTAAGSLLEPNSPDGRAVDPIARALSAPRLAAGERIELVRLLGRTGAPRAVTALLPLAESATDPVLREAALDALGAIGHAGQEQVLLQALADEHPGVRRAAALALRKVGSEKLTAELVRRLERAAEQDRPALGLALGGALATTEDRALLERVGRLLRASRDGERDELIEALGRSRSVHALGELTRLLAAGSSPADRAKVAEALAENPKGLPTLRALSADADGSVRANAVWALGTLGDGADLTLLGRALSDRDTAVAGNAAVAAGRIAARKRVALDKTLCSALRDPRGYVRTSALSGLLVAAQRCDAALERRLLAQDTAPSVREAAARLIGNVAREPVDLKALARCVSEDPSSRVADACEKPDLAVVRAREPVTVFVVPAGESAPLPRAPFALLLADGTMRLGATDRRGAVYEAAAPQGPLELGVPAPLLR